MRARRLLLASAGSGSYPGPAAVSLATTGHWNGLSHPRAYHYNGKTYIIWITDAGDVKVGAYNHSTRTMGSATTLHSGFTPQDGTIHIATSIIVRASDHKLVACYAAQGVRPFYRISTNAEDESAWGAETAFMTSVALYTYSFLNQLDNGNLVYLSRFYDAGFPRFKWSYIVSTDGGASWSGQGDILVPDATNANYLYAISHGNRLHIFCTDTNRTAGNPSSVYHLYLDGTTLYQSDGTSIAGPYPVAASTGTLVQDDSGGSARCNGVAFDPSGSVAAIILVNDSDASTTNTIKVARWTGSAWQVDTVVGQGGRIDANNFVASGQIVKNDPDTVYVPVKTGSFFELWRYTSPDAGSTWNGTRLTSSAADNAEPETPLNAAAGARAVWSLGTYTDENDFDFTVWRYG